MAMGLGYMLAGGLLGSANAAGEVADSAIKQRDTLAAEERADAQWRQRMLEQADAKLAAADAMLGLETRQRQATVGTINARLDANAEAALSRRYAVPELGDTPLTPEQQAALDAGLSLQDQARQRDKRQFVRDGRNYLEAAVQTGNADPLKLAEMDSRAEIAAARNETTQARNAATTDVALARLDAAQAKADAQAKEREQGKPPPGYRHTPEGNLEAIPGGPADQKKQGAFNADVAAMNSSFASFDRLAGAANELLNHPGLGGITGLRGKLPNIPGGDAANAQALLENLKSQIGFSVLQDMRNNSKTGGALGAVSDAEGKRLEANLAALDRAQSVGAFKTSLRAIINYTNGAKDRMRESFNLRHGDAPTTNSTSGTNSTQGDAVRVSSREELNALPSGTMFQAPDGSIRVKR